jgi:adenylate kinase family enzyme
MLGRPGSGKSLAYKILSRRLLEEGLARKTARLDDFPILRGLLDRDTEFKRHYRKEGGFVVTDLTLLDEVLKEMNSRLKKEIEGGKVTFVEFARDRYSEALKNFDREVLSRSLILYFYCPFDVCLARNIRRFRKGKGKSTDNHIAPSDIMERYYKHDEYEELFLRSEEEMKHSAPAPLLVIKNDADDLRSLERELERVVEFFKNN